MKILQVSQYFYPYFAGQERYVFQLSKKLIHGNQNVTIFTINHSNLSQFELIDGINIRRFNMMAAPLNNPISLDFLRIFHEMKSFDIIHIHNEHSFVSFVTCIYNLYYRKPIILTCHGQLKFGSRLKDLFESSYSRTIGKFIFRHVTQIVSLSDDDKKYISSFGIEQNKISVLPNAIDIDYLTAKFNQVLYTDLREKFINKRIILYVGRIIPRKGIEYLIKCIPNIVNKIDNAIFILIGNGECLEKIKEVCSEKGILDYVLFLSDISDEDLFAYYKLSEVFILPSLSEGLPTSILEAMYFDTPVVTTNIPGVRNHFSDTALLVAPKSDHELTNSILRLLTDKELATNLSEHGRNHVINNYTWDVVSNSYLQLYKKMAMS